MYHWSYYGVQQITSGIALPILQMHYILMIFNGYDEANALLEFNKDGLLFDTNWLEDLQVDLAPMQNHSLSVNGGKDGLTYNVITTLFDQEELYIMQILKNTL